ncbi:SDR family NAD(P)-dependent oxidoreductase [bacterium]|nr:SDR family NAD(P)-dependent oxidoreductase [bacterium]
MTDPRTIVLTGASRGLGLALARELIARGHTVLGCARDHAAVAELAASHPAPHDFAAVDVADDEAVAAWAGRIVAQAGPPDLVINNAGLMNDPAPLWEVPAAEFDRLMAVNVGGTVNVIRALVPAMIAAGGGVVANLSSGWGRSTAPEVAPYCASKWAVEGLTRALAQELPRGMAAVAVNPGIIDTDMLRQAFGDGAASFSSPEDWAPRAADLFLGLGPADNGTAMTV